MAQPDNGGIPAFAGVERFVEAFDKLVTQPRRHRSRVPVVLFSEPGEGQVGRGIVAGLHGRLHGRETMLAPHAHLDSPDGSAGAPPDDPVLAQLHLFSHVIRQLMETMPEGTGRLRLPCYQLLRSIVTAPPAADFAMEHHQELKDRAYEAHREGSAPARVLWWLGGRDHASGGTLLELLWNFLAGPLFQRLPRAVYAWRAQRLMLGRSRRRPRWYAQWARLQQGTPPTDFFRSARDLVHGVDPEKFDRILLLALLADLDAACRKRLFHPWRRRRVCRFVLLVAEAGDEDSREQRFLRELRSAMEDLGCTSVVAVAGGVRSLAHRIPDIEVATLSAAGAELANVAEHGTAPGRPTGMVVTVGRDAGEAADDPAATYWLRRRPTLAPPAPRWGPRTEAASTVGGMTVLLLIMVGLIGGTPFGNRDTDACRGSTFLGTDGQCVGVAEGAASFGSGSGERAVRDVLELIERQNGEVQKEQGLGGSAPTGPASRTVVYFGPLSGGARAEDPVRGGTLAELRGIALAQRYVNAQALRSGERVPLRVLAANAGDRFKDAPDVARRVVELAERDRSIVGVIGFGQSRRQTYKAIRTLGEAGIPMVGTSGTADGLLRQSGHYYQMAPTDSRAATVMASFVRHARMTGDGRTARRTLLVADPADAYSASVAASFRREYRRDTRVLLYTPADAPEPAPLTDALDGTKLDAVEDLAREVCDAVADEPRTAVVWAARGSQFQLFLNEIARISRRCPKLGVLGDDDVTTALSEVPRPWQVFGGLTLHYVSHGRAPALAALGNGEAAAFLSAYDTVYGKDRDARTSTMRDDAHVALAWDAMRYLALGIDEAWRGTGGHDERLDRSLLQAVLHQGLGEGGFDGATGRIDAHGAAGGGRFTEDKLVLVERGGAAGPRTALLCGVVARGDVRSKWGPGPHSCAP
ncbi:ABC transporter substrate-binding protein [Streptomyces silvensis]|uniref:ABC transporter substrate-binding protein n=1 Tax=Streptomyces silvensis TaxID=1765722 RepID=UPI000A9F935E|nr:ABC transporter substrate-binding protein [Streptomyces silvensis]